MFCGAQRVVAERKRNKKGKKKPIGMKITRLVTISKSGGTRNRARALTSTRSIALNGELWVWIALNGIETRASSVASERGAMNYNCSRRRFCRIYLVNSRSTYVQLTPKTWKYVYKSRNANDVDVNVISHIPFFCLWKS